MHPLPPLKVANGVGNSLNVRWGTSLECISQATVIHVVGLLPACVGSEAIHAVLGKSWRWMDYCVLCPVPFHSDEIKPDRKQRFGYSCPKLQCSILKLWYLHVNNRNGTGAGWTAELHQSGIVGIPWDTCEEAWTSFSMWLFFPRETCARKRKEMWATRLLSFVCKSESTQDKICCPVSLSWMLSDTDDVFLKLLLELDCCWGGDTHTVLNVRARSIFWPALPPVQSMLTSGEMPWLHTEQEECP